ncbi:MAG: hypothetical protein KAR83_04095 [Thermodesulfovibrionales bacterium]|nr:hypothetical protein [Thermodesulfovibrionales bacterium]
MEQLSRDPVLIYFLVSSAAFIIISMLVETMVRRRNRTETDFLTYEAIRREMSEFDLFVESASLWNIKTEQVEKDFKEYLRDGSLPFYLRQMIRCIKEQ